MNPDFHPADFIIILLYFAILIVVGFLKSQKSIEREDDYLLAGRKLTIIPFVATLVATWYGGILGVGEFTYLYGLSNWIVFGFPYYVFALLFALFLAGKIRHAQQTTIPDRFHMKYGKSAGVLSAVFVMILASPAPYILSVGVILHLLFGFTSFPALLIATLFSLVYIYRGGFRSVIRTDILQFILMFSGFGILVFFSFQKYGGIQSLHSSLPPLHLTWTGGHSAHYLLVWFFIALWTFVDPGFYQRCSAARSRQTARRGILASILFWFVFDFLTLSSGLYARMILPHLKEPMLAIPSLGIDILPPVLLGLFFVGLLSTIMSTIDSFGFISAITFGRDIILPVLLRGEREPRENHYGKSASVKWTQIGLLVTGAISLLLAWLLPSVVKLWYALGSVMVPGLLVPFLSTFLTRRTIPGMVWMMAVPAAISLVWFVVGVSVPGETARFPFGIQPFYPGMAVSLGWFLYTQVQRKWRFAPR